MKQILFFFSFLVFHLNIYSQLTEKVSHYNEEYPNSNLININKELLINIEIENDSILISQTSFAEDLFLNESATQYSKESVSYSTFFKLQNIEASSFSLKNGKYIEYKINEFKEKDELNESFHDDIKSLNFIYPNLSSGSKTKLILTEEIKNPRFLSAFYFGGYYPVINSKLTIIADNNIELKFKEFNLDNVDIVFTKVEKRKKTIYSWVAKNIDAIEMEEQTPSFKNYYPHIVPIITQFKSKKNGIIKLTSDVSNLYNWYYSLVKNINTKPANNNLVDLVNSLVKNKKTEIEKVRAIYYWVQNNIKYIAFEYALGGFIPREANDIYIKKYGDCKDNSSILYEMLKIAEIKGNLTWIGTRKIPYSYNELPTPAVDNHMILTYQNEKNTYFLDATGRYIPLELPSSFIQGKEALIGNGFQNFEIKKVPIIDAEKNRISNSTSLWIIEDKLKGNSSNISSGYSKIDMFNDLETLNTSKKSSDFYKEKLQKGNNKFNIENIVEINKYDYDRDFKVLYDFKLPDYIINTPNDIYINLNLNKKLQEYKIDNYRKTDIEVNYKKSYSFVNELNIPEGYLVEYIPENILLENDFIKASISYKLFDNKILYTHTIIFKFLVLKIENQSDYSLLLKKMDKAYQELIILKKNKN